MNIDEEQLNHTTIRLITKAMEEPEPIEACTDASDWHTVAGFITGVLEMRKELLEVLKT